MKRMGPLFFATPAEFRNWLEIHHLDEKELLVGFYKKSSHKKSIDWPQSVDEALCFGWIDGVRKSLDEISYTIRFSPRKPTSIWSAVNIKRARELSKSGRMAPAGLAAFEKRNEEHSRRYSFEQKNVHLTDAFENQFRSHREAWEFFQSLPPSQRKPSLWWVMSAKKEETRLRRLEALIKFSARELPIPLLRLPSTAK